MAVSDDIRKRIGTVELALREADTANAVHAIVDLLKEIADALGDLESRANRAA